MRKVADFRPRVSRLALQGFALFLCPVASVFAQAGPPFLTNDPGTPGNANWEINVASMQTLAPTVRSYQIPQVDLNFGIGDRIQLSYEIPYVLDTRVGHSFHSGWSNANPGIKWRFLDRGDEGWQISTFPQVQTGGSAHSRQTGIAEAGPRYLVPIEISHRLGSLSLNIEAGYYLAGHGPRERILGLVVGRSLSERLQLDAELYDDRAAGGLPHATVADIGGRYRLTKGVFTLFMAGRGISGTADDQPRFMGYFGIQILLSNYGRTFTAESAVTSPVP